MLFRACSVLAVVGQCLATDAVASPFFSGLGHLPGDDISRAFAISADGLSIVGFSQSTQSPDEIEAVRWRNQEILGLGDLPGEPDQSRAFAVSADGSVVVGRGQVPDSNAPGGNVHEAFRWENGSMTGLGFVSEDQPNTHSIAMAISGDGSVIAGVSTRNYGTAGEAQAFRWQGGSMEGLGDLPGGRFASEARDISADGSVVVGTGRSENGVEAFYWQDGVMSGLGDLPGGIFASAAFGVSPEGSIVVGYSSSENGSSREAFRWESGVMTPLGDLPGGVFQSVARASSRFGSVVVGNGRTEQGSTAFLWEPNSGMQQLSTVLAFDYGLDLTGWHLLDATDVSPDGRTIVGVGINPSGDIEAWVATVPEPTAAELIGLTLAVLAIRRTSLRHNS